MNNNPNHNTNAQRNQIVRDITAQRFHFFVVPVEYPYAVVDAELERRFDAEVQQILDSSQGNPLLNVEFLRGRLGAIPVTCYGNRAANVLTTLIQRLSIRPRLAPLRAIAINQFVPASICELRIPNQSEDFDQAIEHLRATNPGTELYSESWRLITASIGNRQNRSGTTFTFASDRALEVRIREYDARRREHSFILLSYSRGCGHASIRLNARYVDNSGKNLCFKVKHSINLLVSILYQSTASFISKTMIRLLGTTSMQMMLKLCGMLPEKRLNHWLTQRKMMKLMVARKITKTWKNKMPTNINKAYTSICFEFYDNVFSISLTLIQNVGNQNEISGLIQITKAYSIRFSRTKLKLDLIACHKRNHVKRHLTNFYLTKIYNLQLTYNGVNFFWGPVCKVRLKNKING